MEVLVAVAANPGIAIVMGVIAAVGVVAASFAVVIVVVGAADVVIAVVIVAVVVGFIVVGAVLSAAVEGAVVKVVPVAVENVAGFAVFIVVAVVASEHFSSQRELFLKLQFHFNVVLHLKNIFLKNE